MLGIRKKTDTVIKKISIIGAGNVGTHLATALEDRGFEIIDVYSRNINNAKKLARKLYDAKATDQLDFSRSEAELFIISVADQAIHHVSDHLVLPSSKAIVVHTSGSIPLNHLANAGLRTGIFYPLQTFSKEKKVKFSEINFCIHSLSQTVMDLLAEVAYTLSTKVYHINDEERKILHVSAVFACNFSNYMLTISKDILEKHQMDFKWMESLIKETMEKSLTIGPKESQTGPAKRNDTPTIDKHLQLLSEMHPEYHKIYEVMTESIIKTYKE